MFVSYILPAFKIIFTNDVEYIGYNKEINCPNQSRGAYLGNLIYNNNIDRSELKIVNI